MIYTIIILSLLLFVILYKYIKLAKIVIKIEDEIEFCLDTIDLKYANMTKILNRPLFLDSPEVKAVVNDIRDVRESLHSIALSMSSNFYEEDQEKNKEDVE